MQKSSLIKVSNLGKKYQINGASLNSYRERLSSLFGKKQPKEEFWALNDINFEVNNGDVLGIIGLNGSGKSTLLKLISRITSPTAGEININGRISSLLEVGTGFHPELTGRENIFLNGTILGMTKAEIKSKFDEIVEFSGVEKFLDTPVKRYSSGMYVRLAFAVAAHLEPEILIIDEVLAVGDAAFQQKCLGKMKDVAKEGRTVLFVSHHMGMVRDLCNRGIYLEKGKLLFDGSAGEAIEYYVKTLHQKSEQNNVSWEENAEIPAQILEARLTNDKDQVLAKFDVFDPIFIRFKYVIRKTMPSVSFNVVVVRNGETSFLTFDTDNSPEFLKERQPGVYTASVRLPSPLKAGMYNIHLGLVRLMGEGIDNKQNALVFEIEERSFNASMHSASNSRIGVMATSIDWDTKRVE